MKKIILLNFILLNSFPLFAQNTSITASCDGAIYINEEHSRIKVQKTVISDFMGTIHHDGELFMSEPFSEEKRKHVVSIDNFGEKISIRYYIQDDGFGTIRNRYRTTFSYVDIPTPEIEKPVTTYLYHSGINDGINVRLGVSCKIKRN